MPENTTITTAEMDAMRPAFLEALAKSRRAANKETISKLASDLATNASRMKYLAMAADYIAAGNAPGEPERGNCVGYLLDILEYLGGVSAEAADRFEIVVSEAFSEVQA